MAQHDRPIVKDDYVRIVNTGRGVDGQEGIVTFVANFEGFVEIRLLSKNGRHAGFSTVKISQVEHADKPMYLWEQKKQEREKACPCCKRPFEQVA